MFLFFCKTSFKFWSEFSLAECGNMQQNAAAASIILLKKNRLLFVIGCHQHHRCCCQHACTTCNRPKVIFYKIISGAYLLTLSSSGLRSATNLRQSSMLHDTCSTSPATRPRVFMFRWMVLPQVSFRRPRRRCLQVSRTTHVLGASLHTF